MLMDPLLVEHGGQSRTATGGMTAEPAVSESLLTRPSLVEVHVWRERHCASSEAEDEARTHQIQRGPFVIDVCQPASYTLQSVAKEASRAREAHAHSEHTPEAKRGVDGVQPAQTAA